MTGRQSWALVKSGKNEFNCPQRERIPGRNISIDLELKPQPCELCQEPASGYWRSMGQRTAWDVVQWILQSCQWPPLGRAWPSEVPSPLQLWHEGLDFGHRSSGFPSRSFICRGVLAPLPQLPLLLLESFSLFPSPSFSCFFPLLLVNSFNTHWFYG